MGFETEVLSSLFASRVRARLRVARDMATNTKLEKPPKEATAVTGPGALFGSFDASCSPPRFGCTWGLLPRANTKLSKAPKNTPHDGKGRLWRSFRRFVFTLTV